MENELLENVEVILDRVRSEGANSIYNVKYKINGIEFETMFLTSNQEDSYKTYLNINTNSEYLKKLLLFKIIEILNKQLN